MSKINLKKGLIVSLFLFILLLSVGIVSANENINDMAISDNLIEDSISVDEIQTYDDEINTLSEDLTNGSEIEETQISLSTKNFSVGKNTINVTVNSLSGNPVNGGIVYLKVNKTTYNATVSAGKASIKYVNLTVGTQTLNITYGGNLYFKESNLTVRVNATYPTKITINSTKLEGKNNITINLATSSGSSVSNGSVIVKINGKTYNGSVFKGKYTVYNVNFEVGLNNLTINYQGNNYYQPSNYSSTIKVQAYTKIEFDDNNTTYSIGYNSFKLKVTTSLNNYVKSGQVKLTVNNVSGNGTLSNGIISFDAYLLPGQNNITAIYLGNTEYKSSSAIDKTISFKMPVYVYSDSIWMSYGTKNVLNIYCNNYNGYPVDYGSVYVDIGEDRYYGEIKNGEAKITIYSPPKVGTYKIITTYEGDDYYENASSEASLDVVKADSYIAIKRKAAYCSSGDSFLFGVFTNYDKYKVMGVKLAVKVYTGKKYKTYYVTTTSGYAVLSASKVSLGKHKVVVSIYNNKNVKAKSLTSYITLKKAYYKITAASVTVKYKSSKYFKILVQNKNSLKPIKYKYINVKVYTGKQYKTYKLKLNSKGIAYLNTKKLSIATHKVIITVPKTKYYNKASKTSYIYVKKYIPMTTVYVTETSGSYLNGYSQNYDFDNDILYEKWLGPECSDPYGMVSVEILNSKIKMDSVTVTYEYNGNWYNKKVDVYSNLAVYTYIPMYISYLETTIKWHYK